MARRKRMPASALEQRAPAAYFQDDDALLTEFDSLADGAVVVHRLIDNSAGFGNAMVRLRKLTLQHALVPEASTDAWLRYAILRHGEGSAPADLNSATIRDARNEKRLLRAPTAISIAAPGGGARGVYTGWVLKTVVLRAVTLDQNDDLSIVFQNIGGAALPAVGPHYFTNVKAFYTEPAS